MTGSASTAPRRWPSSTVARRSPGAAAVALRSGPDGGASPSGLDRGPSPRGPDGAASRPTVDDELLLMLGTLPVGGGRLRGARYHARVGDAWVLARKCL